MNFAPFGQQSTIDQMKQQLEAMQRMQSQQQQNSNILEQIAHEVNALSARDRDALFRTDTYQQARAVYESGFMAFLGEKFSTEYVNGNGKHAAEELLSSIRKAKEEVEKAEKEREQLLQRSIDDLTARQKELEEREKRVQEKERQLKTAKP